MLKCQHYFANCHNICRLHLYLSLSDSDCSSSQSPMAVTKEKVQFVWFANVTFIMFTLC